MQKTFLIFIFILFVLNHKIFSQENKNLVIQFENGLSTTNQLKDSAITHYHIVDRMKLRKVPSVVISVIKNGNIVLSKSYGLADISIR